jgi:hypothetical protein
VRIFADFFGGDYCAHGAGQYTVLRLEAWPKGTILGYAWALICICTSPSSRPEPV